MLRGLPNVPLSKKTPVHRREGLFRRDLYGAIGCLFGVNESAVCVKRELFVKRNICKSELYTDELVKM